ncbi:hypothetical protein NOR_06761 [Metarhizium rileyi]|uniref:Uncharacterized protein n=1 Tax=Metarhizium rileyi (strain RCEF 4871) TaxID=1649241 RepID=A0A166ZYI7_METRR|nr:hypothetical protein NOR_06761 [Metarhizium rileyi RCEF 4871]
MSEWGSRQATNSPMQTRVSTFVDNGTNRSHGNDSTAGRKQGFLGGQACAVQKTFCSLAHTLRRTRYDRRRPASAWWDLVLIKRRDSMWEIEGQGGGRQACQLSRSRGSEFSDAACCEMAQSAPTYSRQVHGYLKFRNLD